MTNWFVSDTHYNHANICRGISKWTNLQFTRPFETLQEMNRSIVTNLNQYIGKNDTLYFLGDWSFGGIQNIEDFRLLLNCENIIFICGNHDHHIKRNALVNKDKNLYASDYFDSIHNYLEIKINGQILVLCHFPIQEWFEMDRGSIMLHGHTHHSLDGTVLNTFYKRMDVGYIDRPYSFEEILKIMESRELKTRYEYKDH